MYTICQPCHHSVPNWFSLKSMLEPETKVYKYANTLPFGPVGFSCSSCQIGLAQCWPSLFSPRWMPGRHSSRQWNRRKVSFMISIVRKALLNTLGSDFLLPKLSISSEDACLQYCKDAWGCSDFTFEPEFGLCIAYDACPITSSEFCQDCVSGNLVKCEYCFDQGDFSHVWPLTSSHIIKLGWYTSLRRHLSRYCCVG